LSNELAIATVTAALGQSLSDAFARDQLGFAPKVTNVRPNAADDALPTAGANVFLFLVTPNAAHRNVDLPTRRPDGTLLRPPTAALDLHYLISFYGDDTQLEPQILLGSAVRALQEEPVLTSDVIQEMLGTNRFQFLKTSDLAQAREPVRFTPASLSLEELSKLWSVVFQTPYVLSVVYQAGVVLIRRDQTVAATRPVLSLPNVLATRTTQPAITKVIASADVASRTPTTPIFLATEVAIVGSGFAGTNTRVVIDGANAPTKTVADDRITLSLPAGTLAGAHAVQVVRDVDFQFPPAEPTRVGGPSMVRPGGIASNVASFAVTPKVSGAQAESGGQNGTISGVTVTVSPAIGKQQRLRLLLNQVNTNPGQVAASYAIAAAPRGTSGDPDATLAIPATGVATGSYLVRVEVDGVASLWDVGVAPGPVIQAT
jgi:hypothetical protein